MAALLSERDLETVRRQQVKNILTKQAAGRPLTAREERILVEASSDAPPGASNFVTTYEELASRLDVSRKSINVWQKKYPEDWPRPRADGRHEVTAWMDFMAMHRLAGMEDDDTPTTAKDWRARELQLKCEKLEIENGKTAGQLVEASEVEAGISAMVGGFNQALDNFGPRLAQKISGMPLEYHEAEEIIAAEIAVLKRTLQRCDFLGQMDGKAATLQTAAPVVEDPRAVAKELPDQRASSKGSPKAGLKKPAKSPTGPPGSSKVAKKTDSVSTKDRPPTQKQNRSRCTSTTSKGRNGA